MRGPVTIAWDPSRNRSGRVVATLLLAAVCLVSLAFLAPAALASKPLPPPPLPLWKKSAPTRALLDAVLGSVTFR